MQQPNRRRPIAPIACISAIILPLFIALTSISALAASVSLRWDPNNPTPEGYRVFARTSGQAYNYSQPRWQGTAVTCTIDTLQDQTVYYFVVRAYDGSLESADSQEVQYVPPVAANGAPVAVDDAYTVAEGGTLNIAAGSGVLANDSDPEGDALTVALGVRATNGTIALNADGSFRYVHNAGETRSDSFTYSISDGHGNIDTGRATITVTPVNDAPTANAGSDRSVLEGQSATLDGSGSYDPDNSTLAYLWRQTAGPSVSLSSANAVRPTLSAPQVGPDGATLEFRLTVTDSANASSSDTCRVQVSDTPDETVPPTGDPDTDADGLADIVDSDDDDDGMPDDWEIYFGLNPTVDDADGDLDLDGIGNRDEYRAGLEPDDAGTGAAPHTPAAVAPAAYSQVSCTPALAAADYADDDGDAHIATQWQVFDTGSGDCLLDVITDRRLTRLEVPALLLTGGRNCHWRLRFFDSGGRASAWSAFSYFTTESAANDQDGNGIPDDQEGQIVPVDGVNASLAPPAAVYQPTGISVASDDTVSAIEQMLLMDPAQFGADETTPSRLPAAMVAYKLILNQPGQRAQVTIHLSDAAPAGSRWVKYDSVNGWQSFADHAVFSADRRSVTLSIKDGDAGDADGVVNGIIVDPSGLDTSGSGASVATSSGTGGGGGGGCFIGSLKNSGLSVRGTSAVWEWLKGRIGRLADLVNG